MRYIIALVSLLLSLSSNAQTITLQREVECYTAVHFGTVVKENNILPRVVVKSKHGMFGYATSADGKYILFYEVFVEKQLFCVYSIVEKQ